MGNPAPGWEYGAAPIPRSHDLAHPLTATLRSIRLLLLTALAFAGAAAGVPGGRTSAAFGAEHAVLAATADAPGVVVARSGAPTLSPPRQATAHGRTPPRPFHPDPLTAHLALVEARFGPSSSLSPSAPEFSRALEAMRDGTVSSFSNGVPPPAFA